MQDNAGEYIIFNHAVLSWSEIDGISIPSNGAVYEVVRIIDGIPLFAEDHYSRLKDSLAALDISIDINSEQMEQEIRRTAALNKKHNCNVRVVVYVESGVKQILMYVSKSYYPSKEEVAKGVPVGLLRWKRSNPNVKLENRNYKAETVRMIREGGFFEVLLVNDEGYVTEGSKSNVFFVKNSKIYTSPGQYILKGITRKHIMDACRCAGIDVVETLVHIDQLKEMEGLFISGTSIKVLPVASIDGRPYPSSTHPVVTAIRDEFDGIIDKYKKAKI